MQNKALAQPAWLQLAAGAATGAGAGSLVQLECTGTWGGGLNEK